MNNLYIRILSGFITLIVFLSVSSSGLAWIANGDPVCTTINEQTQPLIATDGSAGAIIVWQDMRADGATNDIYAQRFNNLGTPLWTANGVAICTAANDQFLGSIISDGSGGAYITWSDNRGADSDIYVQHVNSNGSTLWTFNGLPICTTSTNQTYPQLVADLTGGAIVIWADARNIDDGNDIYAQRVNSSGSTYWSSNGIQVVGGPDEQQFFSAIADGSGGAIVALEDVGFGPGDINAQRIDSSGAQLWGGGVVVCNENNEQKNTQLVSDGSNGAIIVWQDERYNSGVGDIFAQRVNNSGVSLWTTNGISICTADSDQSNPVLARDGSGGAIIAWQDSRINNGIDYDIFAQHMNSSGSTLWLTDGLSINTSDISQTNPQIISDNAGGAVITWQDNRSGDDDIYSLRIDGNASLIELGGEHVDCSTTNSQSVPRLVSDGNYGAIITWQDLRDSVSNDIYVFLDTSLPIELSSFEVVESIKE